MLPLASQSIYLLYLRDEGKVVDALRYLFLYVKLKILANHFAKHLTLAHNNIIMLITWYSTIS